MRSDRVALGTRLGNYRVVSELGATATGVLYAAEHVVLPRRAQIKIASAAMRSSSLHVLREACILEALRHAGLPAVYESGRLPDERPWFAMEAVDGDRVADVLARGPLRPVEVASLLYDTARVLEHAHRRGVIHAGLRPERIVVTSGRGYAVCVTGWSEARTYDAAPAIPHIPTPGSRAYLAPECLRGDAIDDRADVFALGLVAFRALTGALPSEGCPVSLRENCPWVPRELATVIDQMLARDRFDRPSSAEVVADLAWVADAARSGDAMWDLPTVTDVELVDIDGVPAEDVVDARDTIDTSNTGQTMPRIRKPRWTPMQLVTCDRAGIVAGEIEDRSTIGARGAKLES